MVLLAFWGLPFEKLVGQVARHGWCWDVLFFFCKRSGGLRKRVVGDMECGRMKALSGIAL